jgi:hypothetical protein
MSSDAPWKIIKFTLVAKKFFDSRYTLSDRIFCKKNDDAFRNMDENAD